MKIYNLYDKQEYIREYLELCYKEWKTPLTDIQYKQKIDSKLQKIQIKTYDKLILCLLLISNDTLIGFISLFKNDCQEKPLLTPWYATMYIKESYRHKGYSKLLNKALLNEAKLLGYNKVYLKTNLVNYYEKFGATYLETLNNGERLYKIDIKT